MTREERKQAKKREILNIAENYRDERGNVDLSKMRNEKPKVYSKISYYFGNIDEFMMELNSEDNQDNTEFDSSRAGIFRNQLAFARLSILRDKEHLSYEEIGNIYNKTKMYMSKLYRELELSTSTSDTGTTLNRPVVRNQLAYEMMEYLLKTEKMSFEVIGAEFNIEEEYVESQYNNWSNLFSNKDLKKNELNTLAI